jgi:putative ABC transport system permease protein
MNSQLKKGGTFTLIKIAFRNIWRNKRRTAFCFSSVGITVFIMVVNTALVDGQLECINETTQVYFEGHIKAVSVQYEAESESMPVQYPVADGKNWKELSASIHEIPGVKVVLPRISTLATLQESVIKHAVLWGINIQDEIKANHFNFVDCSDGLKEGRWPAPNANECAIGFVFAEKTGLRIGDRVPLKTVSAQFSDKIWNPIITGIFDFDFNTFDKQYIIVDFVRLERLLVLEEGTQTLVIFVDNEKQNRTIAETVQNLLGKGNVITEWKDNYSVALEKSKEPIYFFGFIFVLIMASFLNINTLTMIIHERTKEIGMMGSLGMTRFEIVMVFFLESFFLAALGASTGMFLGGVLTLILTNYPIHFGNFEGMSNTVFFQFSIIKMIQAWLIGVVVTSLFSTIPSLKAASVEPVVALTI